MAKVKGLNLATADFEQQIASLINSSGLPPCVVRQTLEKYTEQVKGIENDYIQRERAEFEKPEQEEKEGVKNG